MNILVISQYYPPEDVLIAPAVARGLAKKGHNVQVITGYPNYPAGRVFPGYRQKWRGHDRDGDISVLRVPLYADHSGRASRRILNYLSFGLSVALAGRHAKGADVIYVYATQMTPALGPWIWRAFGGAPYVLHVQDLWPESILGSSLVGGGALRKVINATLVPWLRSVYKRSAGVMGISPSMVASLVDRGTPEEKAHLVYNWASEDSRAAVEAESSRADGPARVLYAGNVGDMQDLETAVRAAHLAGADTVELDIVGEGIASERLRALADELGATNVHLKPRVQRDQMASLYAECDYSLVTLKDLPIFRVTVPSKFQASLAHGVPVITSVQGDVHDLVKERGLGFTSQPHDVDSLAEAFRAAARAKTNGRQESAERARATYEELFSEASGIDAIESVLFGVVRSGGG